MPRPRHKRNINFSHNSLYFKPQGIPLNQIETINLELEEIEAIRLKDYENLSQEESAKKMEISQPTFHRLITKARNKISSAIIEGKAIQIKKE